MQTYRTEIPIHPVRARQRGLSTDKPAHGLYSLIVRHFLATLSPDAVKLGTEVDLVLPGRVEKVKEETRQSQSRVCYTSSLL